MSTPIKSISKDYFAQAGRLSKWGNVALWTATGILVADFLLGGYKQQIPHWNTALVVQALLLAAYSLLILGSSIVMAKARRVKINDVVDNAFGTDIGNGHSEGYFDNDEIKKGTLRLLYNTAESCFFTFREMKKMTTSVCVKAFIPLTILVLGYPGDEIDGMMLRIPTIQGVHPKKLFLMAGINGLKQMSEEVFKDKYKSLIMALKDSLPGTQIYLQSILPVNNTDFKVAHVDNGKIEKANNIIKNLANKSGCNYINL